MARFLFASVFALAALLVAADCAVAGEPAKSGFNGGFGVTMTLGGSGTAAAAATNNDDTEEAWYHRGYYGGYRGWGGGWGGYRWGPYRNYLAFHPFRPFVNYRRALFNPYYYGAGYYGPSYYGLGYYSGYGGYGGYGGYCYNGYGYGSYGFGGYGGGLFIGINGSKSDATATTMTLGGHATDRNSFASQPQNEPGSFRYDGGPASPVPQVKPDAEPRTQTTPAAVGLPVSLKKEAKPASPYRYKAYGEK